MLHMTIILVSIPLTVCIGWLSTKYKVEWLLIISDLIILIGGISMIYHIDEAGEWKFMASYLLS